MDGVLQIKLARCTSKSNLYLQPSRPKRRARGPGTVPPLMLRFASCLPACQIRSIRRNNLKREGAHAWIASRNWIEKGKRTQAASPHPSGSDGSGGHGSSQVGSARLHLLMQTMLDGGWTPLKPLVGELHDGQQHRTFYASPSATAAARHRVVVEAPVHHVRTQIWGWGRWLCLSAAVAPCRCSLRGRRPESKLQACWRSLTPYFKVHLEPEIMRIKSHTYICYPERFNSKFSLKNIATLEFRQKYR